MIARRNLISIAVAVPIFWVLTALLKDDLSFGEALKTAWPQALVFAVVYAAGLVAYDAFKRRKS